MVQAGIHLQTLCQFAAPLASHTASHCQRPGPAFLAATVSVVSIRFVLICTNWIPPLSLNLEVATYFSIIGLLLTSHFLGELGHALLISYENGAARKILAFHLE